VAQDAPGERELFEELGVAFHVDVPLVDQLAALGLKPDDIRYLAFSHLHFDHVGNANRFPRATWILNRQELAWAPALFSAYAQAKTVMIDGDHDVFGDGSVRILKAPGHTPGSSALLVKLPHRGAVILSGDLYLTLEGRQEHQVPTVNADRADTLASMQRIEKMARNLVARVIVQPDPHEFERLPKPPAYLDQSYPSSKVVIP